MGITVLVATGRTLREQAVGRDHEVGAFGPHGAERTHCMPDTISPVNVGASSIDCLEEDLSFNEMSMVAAA